MTAKMAPDPIIVVIYSEIALKGKNRSAFVRRLINNMRRALAGEAIKSIDHVESRLLIHVQDPSRIDGVISTLREIFGIQTIFVATPIFIDEVDADLEAVKRVACELAVRDVADARHFKVKTRRSDKTFQLSSPRISGEIGAAVQPVINLPVRLSHPDFTIHVLFMKEFVLVFTRRIPGPAGLPALSSGRVAVLLSGGIDSPVAAWMMMRRGCRAEFTHFFSGRSAAEAETDKIVRLVSTLARYSPVPLRLNLVPVVPYEERAMGNVEDSFDMVMFRRFMFKTTEAMARRRDCRALVAGDSLGQVASQTLPNLAAIGPDLQLPVFRPLIALDKVTITDLGKEIGTYEISIEPYRDCCSIRSPRPILNARARQLLERSDRMDLDSAVAESIACSERLTIDRNGVCD